MVRPLEQRLRNVDSNVTLGPVFRISPNELSFASYSSWKDIYGYKSKGEGTETFIKSEFYEIYASGYKTMCIGSEQDPETHGIMKRTLSPAFSTKALLDQEIIIRECIDGSLKKIQSLPVSQTTGLDMTKWFGMMAFDIFGERSVYCMELSSY